MNPTFLSVSHLAGGTLKRARATNPFDPSQARARNHLHHRNVSDDRNTKVHRFWHPPRTLRPIDKLGFVEASGQPVFREF